jgi:hypothetical protein
MPWKSELVLLFFFGCPLLCQDTGRFSSRRAEEPALGTLRAINLAAMQYYWWFKQVPTTLKQLGPTDKRVADRNAADLIPGAFADGIVNGYKFTLRGNSSTGWTVVAIPLECCKDGIRTVYKVENQVVPAHPVPNAARDEAGKSAIQKP